MDAVEADVVAVEIAGLCCLVGRLVSCFQLKLEYQIPLSS